jgi:hypothetical protein
MSSMINLLLLAMLVLTILVGVCVVADFILEKDDYSE